MVKSTRNSSFYILTFLISLTLLSGSILSSSSVSAEDDTVIDDVSIIVPAACTLSGTGMTSHTATLDPGTYTPNIGSTTLKAFCNDNNGFAIFAAGYTGNIVGETNSNKLVGIAHNTETIPTGIGTSGTSQWAMKLATNSNATYPIIIDSAPNTSGGADASFADYHVVPNEYVKVAHRNSNTDVGTNAVGSELTTTYAVNVSSTQLADTYAGKVIYTMVHPANSAAPVACNSNATTISEVRCMQDFGSVNDTNKGAIFDSMVEGTQYTMKDKRDGKTYTIAKLADGNVWMTQNLDLDLKAGATYTNLDTDIGYNVNTGQYETAAWTPIRSTYAATSTQTHEWCAGGIWRDNYCSLNNTPESYDPGNLYWNTTTSNSDDWDAYYGSCDFSTSTPSCNESLNPLSTYTSSTGIAQYHLGNYYNWAAAIASNDASIYGVYSENWGYYINKKTDQSICPAGWTLPFGNGDISTNYYALLWTEYGWDSDYYTFSNITSLTSVPSYSVPSGGFNGALEFVGSTGSSWLSTADNDIDAYYTYFNMNGSAYPVTGILRSYGFSVRCILRGGGGGGVTE